MFKLKSIEIKGIWGQRNIKTDFYDDANVFIGNNGTGKTTFLNIVEAVLTADIEQLFYCSFEEVIINLENESNTRKIKVNKHMSEVGDSGFEYKIGTKKFSIPILREYDLRNQHRYHPKVRNEIKALKEELNSLINFCWLSVDRELQFSEENDFVNSRDVKVKNLIDQRLIDLMRRLTVYQLQLESESSKLSSKFREQVFELMLYKKDFDELNLMELEYVEPEEIKRNLNKAYNDLGLSSRETKEKIVLHSQKIGLALKKIAKWKTDQSDLQVNDVTPLSLLNRTLKMIEISTEIDLQKKEIFKPIEAYLRILKEFVPDKIFKLDTDSSGELFVYNSAISISIGQFPLPIKLLSSGEKQLIILLTEALLQKNTNYIFVADEPELSLHISWQRKILNAIKELNGNAQIIVATHSPEIAGLWRNRIINMGNILCYE
jgi:ABC-type lipoprotein export system ATPase subunit